MGRIRKIDIGIPHQPEIRNIFAHFLHKRFVKYVHPAAGQIVQHLKTVEIRRARHTPVARSLVTAAVLRVIARESIEDHHRLLHAEDPFIRIRLREQNGRQHVRDDPRRPVVERIAPAALPPHRIGIGVKRRQDPFAQSA